MRCSVASWPSWTRQCRAIIDWYSRRVLAWRLSNTLETSFCVEALQEALARFPKPTIFNTDQGSQFAAEAFTSVLRGAAITISMDGKGRCIDNVFVERVWRSLKYEEVFLQCILNRCEGPSRNHSCKLNAVSSICKVSGHKRGNSRSGAAEKKPLASRRSRACRPCVARFGLHGAAGGL